jgi:hypothetical protein
MQVIHLSSSPVPQSKTGGYTQRHDYRTAPKASAESDSMPSVTGSVTRGPPFRKGSFSIEVRLVSGGVPTGITCTLADGDWTGSTGHRLSGATGWRLVGGNGYTLTLDAAPSIFVAPCLTDPAILPASGSPLEKVIWCRVLRDGWTRRGGAGLNHPRLVFRSAVLMMRRRCVKSQTCDRCRNRHRLTQRIPQGQ